MIVNKQRQIIKQTYPFLNELDLDQLFEVSKYRALKNKERFVELDNQQSILFFILKGMVRGYFYDKTGEEKNMILKPEGNFSGMTSEMFRHLKQQYIFEAIHETHILIFCYEAFETLTLQSFNLSRLYIEGLKENVFTLFFRIELLAGKSPEERYEALLEHAPQLFEKAYHKHIANYIGVTPNSLSRIIKRRVKSK